jgi:hypothetical protein
MRRTQKIRCVFKGALESSGKKRNR